MSKLYNRNKSTTQAVKTSKAKLMEKKLGRMMIENRDYKAKQQAVRGKTKSMGKKVAGKMGPSARNSELSNGRAKVMTRKDDRAMRGRKMVDHFKKILSGRTGRMQGNK